MNLFNFANKSKLERRLFLRRFGQTLLMIGFVCLFAYLFDKWIEAVFFCISHIYIREKFEKKYHSDITAICMTISAIVVFFGIVISLPVSLSLLSSIPIAWTICCIGFLVKDNIELHLIVDKEKIFREQCFRMGMSSLMIEIAVDYKIYKMSAKDMAEKYNYELQTIKNYRTNINRQLREYEEKHNNK